MKISTEIHSASLHVGEERAIELLAKAGFDAWDLSMFRMCDYDWNAGVLRDNDHPLAGKDYLKFVRRLKQIGLDNGIVCNQSHAPFPVRVKAIRDMQKRAIECTAEAGGQICIVHPDNNSTPEQNAEMYFELLPFAKEHGVKIATENMWNWDAGSPTSTPAACSTTESFLAHLEAVNDPSLVACLDLGHAEMQGSGSGAVNMIRGLGHHLQALHIHDNDLLHDSHQLPYTMQMDFDAIARALKEIGYKGYFTLEADRYLAAYTADTVLEGARKMVEAARRMADVYERA